MYQSDMIIIKVMFRRCEEGKKLEKKPKESRTNILLQMWGLKNHMAQLLTAYI